MGWVYIFTNQSFSKNNGGIVKIGKTKHSIRNREKELDWTNLPTPFKCYYAIEVDDINNIEKYLHNLFENYRIRSNREFFQIKPEVVKLAILGKYSKSIKQEYEEKSNENLIDETGTMISPDDLNLKKRKSNFKFKDLKIPIGSKLIFTKNENEICYVDDENQKVKYNGNPYSLSGLSNEILRKTDPNKANVNGTLYWKFNGKTINKIRKELEEK